MYSKDKEQGCPIYVWDGIPDFNDYWWWWRYIGHKEDREKLITYIKSYVDIGHSFQAAFSWSDKHYELLATLCIIMKEPYSTMNSLSDTLARPKIVIVAYTGTDYELFRISSWARIYYGRCKELNCEAARTIMAKSANHIYRLLIL